MSTAIKFGFGLLVASLLAAVAYVVYLEQLVRYWDREITALCAADGGKNVGLRVYERVMAPEQYLRPALGAMPADLYIPRRHKTPTDPEPIIEQLVYLEILRKEKPKVARFAVQIFRVADGKVLAEEIRYMRAGGGMPMPTPAESHMCPEMVLTPKKRRALYQEAFINHPLNK